MDKILLAIDAVNPNRSALDFACYLAKLTNSKITGIFLENLVADERPMLKSAYGTRYLEWDIDESSVEYLDKRELIEKNIQLFKDTCEQKFTKYNLHRDRGVPHQEIVNESRYADLIIVDPSISFNKKQQNKPSAFVKHILKDTECPVIIAPNSFEGIDELIVAYDGSRSAAFAIKQFSYLFPEFDDRKITVLQVNKEGEWNGTDKHNLKEWLQNRYSAIGFEVVKGNAEDELFNYVLRKKKSFVIMGAYGRNALSRYFKPSQADAVIKNRCHPIFISHY
jgi:hypothetical protein